MRLICDVCYYIGVLLGEVLDVGREQSAHVLCMYKSSVRESVQVHSRAHILCMHIIIQCIMVFIAFSQIGN
jgi:hypothetical protein